MKTDNIPEMPLIPATYRKVAQEKSGLEGTQLWMIVCDEDWRESIVCKDMYEWAADWLIAQIQGKPFGKG